MIKGKTQVTTDSLVRNKATFSDFCQERGKHPKPKLNINDVRLHYRWEIIFLGLDFDIRLTCNVHVYDLAARRKSLLNAITSIFYMALAAGESLIAPVNRANAI